MDAEEAPKSQDAPAEVLSRAIDADREHEGDVRPEPDTLAEAVSTGDDADE